MENRYTGFVKLFTLDISARNDNDRSSGDVNERFGYQRPRQPPFNFPQPAPRRVIDVYGDGLSQRVRFAPPPDPLSPKPLG